MSESYSETESRIQKALIFLHSFAENDLEKPNIAAVAREFEVQGKKLLNGRVY